MTYFQLGHNRTLQAVADKLDQDLGTIKRWSSKFNWGERIQSFNAGVLQQHAEAEATTQKELAAEWSKRMAELRRLEWAAVQKLLSGVHCYLEGYGEEQLETMSLAQVARTLSISSAIARKAIGELPEPEPEKDPLTQRMQETLRRVLGKKTLNFPGRPQFKHPEFQLIK